MFNDLKMICQKFNTNFEFLSNIITRDKSQSMINNQSKIKIAQSMTSYIVLSNNKSTFLMNLQIIINMQLYF